jgi:hypothetical protein
MKLSQVLFVLILTAYTTVQAQSYPNTLVCTGVKFIKGEKNFDNPSFYFPVTVTRISSTSATLVRESSLQEGTVTTKDGVTTLDFSDGDQYRILRFKTRRLLDPAQKALGTFEDSYTWSDGYHTRALYSISCSH